MSKKNFQFFNRKLIRRQFRRNRHDFWGNWVTIRTIAIHCCIRTVLHIVQLVRRSSLGPLIRGSHWRSDKGNNWTICTIRKCHVTRTKNNSSTICHFKNKRETKPSELLQRILGLLLRMEKNIGQKLTSTSPVIIPETTGTHSGSSFLLISKAGDT